MEWLKLFVAIFFLLHCVEICTGQGCQTDNKGPEKKAPCIFPFVHSGKTYEMCTNDRDPDGKLWCWRYKTFFFAIFDIINNKIFIIGS